MHNILFLEVFCEAYLFLHLLSPQAGILEYSLHLLRLTLHVNLIRWSLAHRVYVLLQFLEACLTCFDHTFNSIGDIFHP